MVSRTRLLEFVRGLRAADVAAALATHPSLAAWRDERGRSLLHVVCGLPPATWRGREAASLRTADALLAAGLGVNAPAFSEGAWRATPLWYAVARGANRRLASHLLVRGADPNHCLWAAAFHDDAPMIRLLVAAGADLDPVTEDETPLLAAVKTSHFRAAAALLALGADPNFQDSSGRTALHYMLRKGSDERHLQLVARYGARADLADRDGVTALAVLLRKRSPWARRLAARLGRSAAAGGGSPARCRGDCQSATGV